jgi:hypothetical protein
MDPLLAEAIARHQLESPADRLREALQVMSDGFALKLANLRRQNTGATTEELQSLLQAWIER